MAINPPVDATKTPEWAALQKHYDELQAEGVSLKQWFADDAERVDKLSFDAGDLHFDLSKNLIKPETLQLFADLAKAVKLDERTKAMYTGVHINNTEDRAVLHTALRRPVEDEGKYIVDGQDTVKDVREVLDRIYAFADEVRSGKWTGVTGKKIETVVNIGIGGSDWAPSWCTRRSSPTRTPASPPVTSPTSTRTTWPRRPRASTRRPPCSSSSPRPSPRWRP